MDDHDADAVTELHLIRNRLESLELLRLMAQLRERQLVECGPPTAWERSLLRRTSA